LTSSFQVLHVVLGNGNVDVVQKLVLRAGVFGDDSALFYEMHFDAAPLDQFLKREAIGPVSIQPVGLLNQNDPAFRVRFQEAQHGAELPSAWIPRRFHVHKGQGAGAELHARGVQTGERRSQR